MRTEKQKKWPKSGSSHGINSVCEVLIKYLHSRPVVAAKLPNAGASQWLVGLLCIQQEMKTVSFKQVMCHRDHSLTMMFVASRGGQRW
jgi:hypothetical protein